MIENTTYGGDKATVGRYDSGSEFLDALRELSGKKGLDKRYFWQYEASDWMGLTEFAQPGEAAGPATARAMREGYPAGAALIDSIGSSLSVDAPTSIKRRMVWSDHGDELNIQAVWNGDLDRAWRRPHRAPSLAPKRVTVIVDALASGFQGANEMAVKGAAAVKLVDLLSSAGYSTRLVSAWHGTRNREFLLAVTTKGYADPVDINSLAATIVLPSFFRCLGHLWGALIDKQHDNGYMVRELEDSAIDAMLGDDAGEIRFIAGQGITTTEQAEAWLAECLSTFNTELQQAA